MIHHLYQKAQSDCFCSTIFRQHFPSAHSVRNLSESLGEDQRCRRQESNPQIRSLNRDVCVEECGFKARGGSLNCICGQGRCWGIVQNLLTVSSKSTTSVLRNKILTYATLIQYFESSMSFVTTCQWEICNKVESSKEGCYWNGSKKLKSGNRYLVAQ